MFPIHQSWRQTLKSPKGRPIITILGDKINDFVSLIAALRMKNWVWVEGKNFFFWGWFNCSKLALLALLEPVQSLINASLWSYKIPAVRITFNKNWHTRHSKILNYLIKTKSLLSLRVNLISNLLIQLKYPTKMALMKIYQLYDKGTKEPVRTMILRMSTDPLAFVSSM